MYYYILDKNRIPIIATYAEYMDYAASHDRVVTRTSLKHTNGAGFDVVAFFDGRPISEYSSLGLFRINVVGLDGFYVNLYRTEDEMLDAYPKIVALHRDKLLTKKIDGSQLLYFR